MAKHGNVIGFYVGTTPMVILTDGAMIKELFKSEALAARPGIF